MIKKRILFITNHFQRSDGVARSLLELANNMNYDKFDVTIVSLFKVEEDFVKELNLNVKFKKIFGFYFRGLSTIVSIFLKQLYYYLIKDEFDIVVGYQAGVPTKLVGKCYKRNIVNVLWMHGYQIYKKEYSNCDRIVCVSKKCCDDVRNELKEYNKINYLYNLVDDKKIINLSKENLSETFPKIQSPILISVGRHSHEKGYVRLIKILSKLKMENLKFTMILVGDGPEHKKIVEMVNKYKMNENIILLGSKSNPYKYVAKSDLFICSSYSEGYSTACTESAILGVPILTTNVSGAEEIIEACKCGKITGISDEELESEIRKILENTKKIDDWKKILKNTSTEFGLEKRKIKIEEFFDELIVLSDKRKKK